MKLSNLSMTLLLACTLAACNKQDAGTDAASTTPPATPAETAPPAESTPALAVAEITGIAECDSFLTAYEQCLKDKVPAQYQAQMDTGLAQWKQSWRDMAANDATKGLLPNICTQARDSSKPAMQAYGCEL